MSLFESRWATGPEPEKEMQKDEVGGSVETGKPLPQFVREEEVPVEEKPLPTPRSEDQSPRVDKPLPPPPPEELEELEEGEIREPETAPPLPISKSATPPLPISKTATPPPPAPLAPRQRIKAIWKGKACWIGLPRAGPEAYGRSKPLSAVEVDSRLRHFEQSGYNTNGFDVDNHWAGSAVSQSRDIYPDSSNDAAVRQKKDFQVRVPDPKAWRAYMDQQIEAKLAALGVSFGDDLAPAPPPLSRQSSGHFPRQSVSPNNLVGSIPGGSHRSTPSLAHFSTAGHSHSASMASPLSMPGPPGHMHRHSVFGMPYGFPQQQTAHSGLPAFSPGGQFSMNGLVRGGSPAVDRLRSEGPAKSPVSPFGPISPFGMSKSPQQFPPELNSIPAHLRHQSVYSSFSPQPVATPTIRAPPALPELPEDEEEQAQDYFSGVRPESQHTEIIQPSPRGRGHRHNISEGLERDIQEAEYHLERSIEREMNAASEANDSFNRRNSQQKQEQQAYVPPAKRASLGMNGNAAQIPSPQPVVDGIANAGFAAPLQNKLLSKTKGHASKLSVAAAEFKFNPGGMFAPQPAVQQQPALQAQPVFQPQPAFQPQQSFAQPTFGQSGDQSSSGNLDLQNPAFQPGFGGYGGSALPPSDFNFSSAVENNHVPASPTHASLPSIFGNVTIRDAPAKRSKAITIKAPVQQEPEKVEKEDSHGRILQSEERQKRARTKRDDGDGIPLFAERPPSPVRKESPPKPVPESMKLGSTPPMDQKEFAAPAVSAKKDVKPSAQITSAEDFETLAEIPSLPEHERNKSQPGHKKNTSSLSALAKPFDFKPAGATSFTPQEPPRTLSPHALKDKPDFSPQRVFSHGNPLNNHKAVESLSYNTSPEPRKHSPYRRNESEDFRHTEPEHVDYPEPTFDEIDAVMQQLNDSEHVDSPTRSPARLPEHSDVREVSPDFESSVLHFPPAKHMRSDAPSPSPRHVDHTRRAPSGTISALEEDFAEQYSPQQFEMPTGPSIHRLNRDDDVPMSEWSDDIDVDEEIMRTRSRFFDNRIDNIVGNVIQDHLQPLEKSLQLIHRAISSTRSPRSLSRPATVRTTSVVDSDADDEDDLDLPLGKAPYRSVSGGKERRMAEQIKAAVLDAFSIQEMNEVHKSPGLSSAVEIHHAIMDMNTTIARIATANIDLDDVRAVVQDALHRNSNALARVPSSDERSHKRAITELEGRFNETLAGKLEEANQRRMTEEREADTRRLLRLAEEELSLLRETTRDQDHRIHSLQREFQTSLGRAEEAESAKRKLEKQLSDAEAENSAFESTLDEYRLSSNKWRQEVDDLSSENESLKSNIGEMKAQIADGLNIRENMRVRLDKIHADMAGAAEQLANEKSHWQTRNEELQKKSVMLQARIEGEAGVRRSLEEEVRALRAQVHDGVSAKIHLEQALRSSAVHEDAVNTLKIDLAAEQTLVTRLERDLHEARESGRAEVQRTQMIMETSIESTNSQAAIIRSSLEHELHRAKNEVDDLRMSADTAKARHELLLEEEADLRRDALRRVNETSSASLNDLREKHQDSLRYMKLQHERELTNALEDKHRAETYLQDRLGLSNDQVAHLQDRVSHLEERLQVAKSAAQAAAKQAQAARYSAPSQAPAPAPPASVVPVERSLDSHEKISPQALRESILVLQEQLQERETRIESLTNEITSLDTTAPGKLIQRDTEITWLRELLAVRNEDLSELIRQLELDNFDREAVRDYAIRISAGIQMEQAEKERLISAGTSKAAQAVAGLVNAASPGAARLASAWGNWRKGRTESTSSSSAPAAPARASVAAPKGKAPASRVQTQASRVRSANRTSAPSASTPSKPSPLPSPSIFAGLMTPPASNLRRTPVQAASSAPPASSGPEASGAVGNALPAYQQGTVHPGFTQAAPPGFGARRVSPLHQSQNGSDEDEQELGAGPETPELFGDGGYDSDADEGAVVMPEESVIEDDYQSEAGDAGEVDQREQPQRFGVLDDDAEAEGLDDEIGLAEETLGRSLAAELENL